MSLKVVHMKPFQRQPQKQKLVSINPFNALQFVKEYNLICDKKSTLPKRVRDHIIKEVQFGIDTELLVVKDRESGEELPNVKV